MTSTHWPTSILALLIAGAGIGLAPGPVLGQDGDDGSRLINDCGVNSLYLMLKLRAAEVDLADLRRALPSTAERGLSLAEIRAASARFGCRLRGAKIGARDVPLDRPAIVLLKPEGGEGHFVVLEPVGVLGKMVMVLDFPRPPRVVDSSEIMGGAGWTGLALTPVAPWERYGPWVASGVGVSLVALGIAAPWRRRHATGSPDPGPAVDGEGPGP